MLLLVSGATATLRRHLDSPFLGHLLVPAAGNSMRETLATGLPWAVDNGAFAGFHPAAFAALLGRIAGKPGCLFVACPDVVGDARATLAQYEVWQPVLAQMGLPVALVGQDGLEALDPPWGRFQALFLGGSTEWKLSEAAARLAREARARGLWVHLGRCNTLRRFRHAHAIGCYSVDGTAFSRWPEHHIPRALGWLASLHGAERPGPAAQSPTLPLARRTGNRVIDLPGWVVDRAERLRGEYRLWARYEPEPCRCPSCGADRLLARGPRRHGSKRQRVLDLPRDGRRVVLHVSRRRYRCSACRRTFLQPLPDVCPGRPLTRRLVESVLAQKGTRPHAAIAREVGVDEKTVRNLLATEVIPAAGGESIPSSTDRVSFFRDDFSNPH